MIELIIKYSNGSVYWVERFNDLASCNLWLVEEKTRPYWNKSFTTQITDNTPPAPTQAELDAIAQAKAQKQSQIDTFRSTLNDLDALSDITAAQVKQAVRTLYRLLKLNGSA